MNGSLLEASCYVGQHVRLIVPASGLPSLGLHPERAIQPNRFAVQHHIFDYRLDHVRKFFRFAFLLPLMLSPAAVPWMIGKSMFVTQPAGPVVRLLDQIGFEKPLFYSNPWI